MNNSFIIGFIIACFGSLVLTPLVKQLAIKLGVVDKPDSRKVHQTVMPRMGGLAIYLAFMIAYLGVVFLGLFEPVRFINAFLIGAFIIVLTGALDDKYQISPKHKLIGQVIAALIIVFYGEKVKLLNIPFDDHIIHLGWLGIPITIIWIVGVTNAINLIDGLDGLAAGVSAIAAASLFFVALSIGNMVIALICVLFVGAIVGFLYFNFHPATIFMGDTGSLFLGFALASLSLLQFKQATVITFLIPVLILGVPISDTLFAIIRRIVNKKPISAPDKNHLHHRLLKFGFSHRKAVLIIYGISTIFGILAVVSTKAPIGVSVFIIIAVLIFIEIIAEVIGLVTDKDSKARPILQLWNKVSPKKK